MDEARAERLRLAEPLAALSLAIDLGLGQPMAHGLRTCLLALELGRALRLSERQLTDIYFTTLLRFVGCTADSHDLLDFAAGEDVKFRQLMVSISSETPDEIIPQVAGFMTDAGPSREASARAREAIESPAGIAAHIAAVHCEIAAMLAARLGLGGSVCAALERAFERWDGLGYPGGHAGEDVPLPIRVAVVARDIELLTRMGGDVRQAVRRRRGAAYDPRVVDAFLAHESDVLNAIHSNDVWHEVLHREPGGPRWVPPEDIDRALTALADFADAKAPFTLGHSRAVAELAEAAVGRLGRSSTEAGVVRRAALLHDIGRSGIPNSIWEQNGPLTTDQWERVRLHTYYTERILNHCDLLRPIGTLAAAHHERLDGSGYHRGSAAANLGTLARVLAAADACHAMRQPRPHRQAHTLESVASALQEDVSKHRLDAAAVEAVLASAGAPARATPAARPANLTDREVQVLRLMAQGLTNREMATSLEITPKTAGHHVQHIYDKIGVSTRAAAAVFAVEHRLL